MTWKEIIRVWTDRTTKCSICGRPHYIANLSLIPEEAKKSLKPMECHLPIHPRNLKEGCRGYIGSYIIKEGEVAYTCDVYDFPISMKQAYLEISIGARREKKVEEEKENLAETMKAYEDDFEGSYIYYDDEDMEDE